MREKLIELLNHEFGVNVSTITADWLIANGVTIPVRCKECKYRCEVEPGKFYLCDMALHQKGGISGEIHDDNFCNLGQRKSTLL